MLICHIRMTSESALSLRGATIQVNVSRSTAADDDDSSAQAAVAGAAKGRLISAMMKKHLVEGMIPVRTIFFTKCILQLHVRSCT